MHFSSDLSEQRRISWKDIRKRSSVDPQRPHPCRLYQNFSESDSFTSSKVPRLITFSQLRNVDRSLQTSFCPDTRQRHRDRSLPDLSFLQHYAKENLPSFASTCSSSENSTSSSGYSSSTTHPRRLKSCLKRQKSLDVNVLAGGLAGDILTLTRRTSNPQSQQFEPKNDNKRASMPIIPPRITRQQHPDEWILSDQDLRTKKSVSFCTEIVRRMITPASSPDHRTRVFPLADDCDFVPRETFNESPPNEFQFESDEDESDCPPTNFIQTAPEHLPRPLARKYPTDRFLIDAFAKTILRILEIKCNYPKVDYLNNLTNEELDCTLRHDLCPLLYEVLDDGLRQNSSSLFSRKTSVWRLIDVTTPMLSPYNEAKNKAQLAVPSAHDSIERFSAFVYHLLK